MSLRIIVKPNQIIQWIHERQGTPVRRRGSDTDLRVLFNEKSSEYEPISQEDLIETMKFHNLVMLVDQEPGKTHHKIYRHS